MLLRKKVMLTLVLIALLAGCASSKAAPESTLASSKLSPLATSAPHRMDLSSLNITLPPQWGIRTVNDNYYEITNEQSTDAGWISAREYDEKFDFEQIKPNHSSVIRKETFDIPIGKCQLITLDADNGSAASGLIGTHNDYYALINVKDETIYIWSFTLNDKAEETKELFIGLLNKLSLKESVK